MGYNCQGSGAAVVEKVILLRVMKFSGLTVSVLLSRCKMRQRDPRLFYLSMEISIRRSNARTLLILDDDARPAMLQACQPAGESR